MNKTLALIAFLSVIIFSCKKDNKSAPGIQKNKTYPVTFNLTNFQQANTPIDQSNKTKTNATTPPTGSTIKKLLYKLFDSNQTLIRSVAFRKNDSAFSGTLKESLASGRYSVVFIGLADTVNYTESISNVIYYGLNRNYVDRPFSETFYKKINITVDTTAVQQDVILKRITSQVEVIVNDPIPSGITNIYAYLNYGGSQYNYITDVTSSFVQSFTLQNDPLLAPAGTTHYSLGVMANVLNTNGANNPMTLKITASGKSGIVVQKTLYNITTQPNSRTIVSGNLFTNGASDHGFKVTFIPAYSGNDLNFTF